MTADIKLLPLPEPYGYLRELDGRLQMSIGPVRPADRAGGYATPWAAMYDTGRVRANVAHATAAKDDEIERLRAEVEAVWAAMPRDARYLDPPDGGCVPLHEQVRRMAADATRAERLAEALQMIEKGSPVEAPDLNDWADADERVDVVENNLRWHFGKIARAALRDHDQEGKDG